MVMLNSNWPIYTYRFDSAEELNSLLSKFNNLVQEKTYEKTAYKDWRKLLALSKSQTDFIHFEYDAHAQEVSIYTEKTHLTPLTFSIYDVSFGEFLYVQHVKYPKC